MWRRTVVAWVIVILGVTLLLLIGPLLDMRAARAAIAGAFVSLHAAGASLLLAGGAAAIWLGAGLVSGRASGASGQPCVLRHCR